MTASTPDGPAARLRAGRTVVLGAGAVLLAGFVTGLVLWLAHAGELAGPWTTYWAPAQVRDVLAGWGMPARWFVGYFVLLELLLAVVTVVAVHFVLRGALSWFRLYLAFALVLFATAGGGVPLVLGDLYPDLADLGKMLQGVAWVSLFPLAYVFPDGRFTPRWTRWLAVGWVAFLAGEAAGVASVPALEAAVLLVLSGSCAVAQVYRYVRVSGPVQRQQTMWVMLALALRFALNLAILATPLGDLQSEVSERGLVVFAVVMLLSYAIAAALPAAIAIAILRYRLFDVHLVISRTLAYSVLTAFVVGTYALIVGGAGVLWPAGGGTAAPLVAAGLVAVAFNPVRERVQRAVNRLVYGDRDDPYGVLSRLGRHLAAVVGPDRVAPTIVDTVARALKAPYVAVTAGEEVLAAAGRPGADPETFPLSHQGHALGRLVVGRRSPADRFAATDRRLLTDLADQCGAALYAAQEAARTTRLAADLQHAREQLVAAREEERRRLRRDLHDSLGPALGSQALTIDAARALMATDQDAADTLLRDLKAQSQEALGEVRRMARMLRPPALDELGLAEALRHAREQYQRVGLRIDVEIEAVPALPAAVEVAVYRIAHEAFTNVVRHAGAGTCTLTLAADGGAVDLTVADDGRGFGAGDRAGVGRTSMRERAEELGGTLRVDSGPTGTRVHARIPLRPDATTAPAD